MKLTIAVALIALVTTSPAIAENADSEHAVSFDLQSMSANQVFSFNESNHDNFGHLVELKVAGVKLEQDVSAVHPVTKAKISVVGAVTSFRWNGGPADPLDFGFTISSANRSKLEARLKEAGVSGDVEFSFQIFGVDPAKNERYIRLKTFSYPFRGVMNKIGSEIESNRAVSLPLKGSMIKDGKKTLVFESVGLGAMLSVANQSAKLTVVPIAGGRPQNLIMGSAGGESLKLRWGN